jgi:cell division protein FtsQ
LTRNFEPGVRNPALVTGAAMWDRPDILNAAASALYGLAALLALIAAVTFTIQLPIFPVREVRVDIAPTHVTREEVETIVRRELRGNFFTVDLDTLRAAFARLPWVRSVELRRRWPDQLEVRFEEHQPLARWGTAALVSTRGETFEAAYKGPLPVFVGPPGAAKEMAIQYEYFRRRLAGIGQRPVQVLVSPRRAWRVKLESGLTLELGREQIETRLARFVAAYQRAVAPLEQRIEYVDLRYANGFAVRIPETGSPGPDPKHGRKTG